MTNRTPEEDRAFWCNTLYKIAAPILCDMSEGKLITNMPIEYSPTWDNRNKKVAYMECFGRLMAGLSPWLNLPDDNTLESQQRQQLRIWALKSYAHAVDPGSADYLLWDQEWQPLVDAAYLVQSFLRGYERLWLPLDSITKERYLNEFKRLRKIVPPYNNWLLFPAIIELFLMITDSESDFYRIKFALTKIEEWYQGDGYYTDGESFTCDYYNSFVIQPMYVECLETLAEFSNPNYCYQYEKALKRMQRFGCILERLISPEGYFSVIGRSVTYRTGILQPLSMLVLNNQLPKQLSNGQVRAAMTAVIQNMFRDNRNFTSNNYLVLGFNGHQPEISDYYTNTGSLYMTSQSFLPLGLPSSHPFWTEAPEAWTAQKAWYGMTCDKDCSIK